jgi:hypothetical protein
MMNNLFNAIVIAALIGTFLLAPMPQPSPLSVASQPSATAVALPAIDSPAAKGAAELELIVGGSGRASTD